jgi:hypothetical protein
MGTSVSHPSPDNTNWKPVLAGYTYENVPLERVLSDIWRAVENDPQPLTRTVESEALFRCQQAIQNSTSVPQALRNVSTEITKSRQNSIVAELARRAVPVAFKSEEPARAWRTALFSEVTNYLVSRDISGFIGERYRNSSVGELIEFKRSIRERVGEMVGRVQVEPRSPDEWRSFVREAVNRIRGGRE